MEQNNKKINILYLFPGPIYRPDLPDFRDRFDMLSDHFQGHIFSWSHKAENSRYRIKNFLFESIVFPGKGFWGRLRLGWFMLRKSLAIKDRIEVIICYDPIFTGIVGVFLKLLFRCKLIIELNSSDLGEAMMMERGRSVKVRVKIFISKSLRNFSLFFTDGIKLLTELQRDSLEPRYLKKKVFCFHDFVPTHYFQQGSAVQGKYILSVGFPFYRKGVDILVKAFERIASDFPEFKLKFIGHRLQQEAEEYLGSWHDRIEFCHPFFYDELQQEFLNCYCLVLPSREEGMGRVLIEAMACGKPVIGANVGGIPSLIENQGNGFLFESEDVDALSEKLKLLMSDQEAFQRMGMRSKKLVEEKFSSIRYCDHFKCMINNVLDY